MMTTINNANNVAQPTPIQKFYSGSSIFITGGTGFLGKVLIEKLLRTCPDIQVIYLLIRDKRGVSAHQRVDKLLEDPLFERLKRERPNCRNKLVVVKGDCSTAGMGLNPKCMQILINQVNIIFHVAATVRFDEKLRTAMNINVKGTISVLEICKKMIQLKSLVYVSTAYSNCYLEKKIGEEFYDFPYNYEELSQLVKKLDDNTIDQLTPRILGNWPNTYTMTKAMAESVVQQYSRLPAGVFRPAIVVSTYEEPIPGWTDNYYGPTGIVSAALVGILHTMSLKKNANANIVPVDMCVNALVASAKDVADKWENTSTPLIYNYVSNVDNPVTWGNFNQVCKIHAIDYPVMRAILPMKYDVVENVYIHDLYMFLMLIPGLIIDLLRMTFCFRKPILFKTIFKMRGSLKLFQRFAYRSWEFSNDRVKEMEKDMDEKDKELFDFNMKRLDWLNYTKSYILGVRRYLIKEDDNTLAQAKVHQNRLNFVWNTIVLFLGYFILNWLMKAVYSVCSNVYSSIGF